MAGPLICDRVWDTSVTTGTGALTLANSPVTGHRSFGSVLSNLDTAYVCVRNRANGEFELGEWRYGTSGPTLTRVTTHASSNGGAAVSWTAGTKDVQIVAPAAVFAALLNPNSLAYAVAGNRLVINDGAAEVNLTAALSAIEGLTPAADRLPYYTGSGTAALATLTSFIRGLLDDTDAPTARNTLGVPVHAVQPGGRLTLSSTLSVTLSDQTAASTLYYLPHAHNRVPLYDGTNWNLRTISGVSLSLSGLTSGRNYDVFCYDNAGTPTLELTAWTDDTTRATALTTQDGRLVRSGATTRLYLGTIRTTGTTTTEDSAQNRYVWNAYHRAARALFKRDTTSHAYSTGSWREWNNGSDVHRVRWVAGLDADAANLFLTMYTDASGGTLIGGLAVDATNVDAASATGLGAGIYAAAPFRITAQAQHVGQGYHYAQCCEWGGTAGLNWARYELRGTVWG